MNGPAHMQGRLGVKSPWVGPLERLCGELRVKDDEVRMRAAKDLSQYVATQARDFKSDLLGVFMNDMNNHISNLVNSSNSHDVMGGIIAIYELFEVDFRSHTISLARLAESLRVGLNSTDTAILSLSAQALGRLSHLPITLTSDMCVTELKRALESLTLKERHEIRRHGAVLVLRALAAEAPTLFYGQMSSFVEVVWVALRDSKLIVRYLAAETLGLALRLIGERENAFQWNRYLFEETQIGIRTNATEPAIHGSLLALGEMLSNSTDFMSGRTNEVCAILQRYAREKDKYPTIKQTVTSLLPRVAASNPDTFVDQFLDIFMEYLLANMQAPGSSAPAPSGSLPLTAAGYQTYISGLSNSSGSTFYQSHSSSSASSSGLHTTSSTSSNSLSPFSPTPLSTQPTLLGPSDTSERSLALFTIGELALALIHRRDAFRRYLPQVMKEIRDTLTLQAPSVPAKQRTSAASVNDALACLTMLAQAVGPAIHLGTGMRELLDQIFSVKLSPQLIAALTALVDHIPSLVKDIQLRLVDKLSGVLKQKFTPNTKSASTTASGLSNSTASLSTSSKDKKSKLVTSSSRANITNPQQIDSRGDGRTGSNDQGDSSLGASSNTVENKQSGNQQSSGSSSTSSKDQTSSVGTSSGAFYVDEERTPELIALALRTLGSFNVIGYIQNIDEFLRDIAVNFLEEDNTTIRREAAVAVPQLLVRICNNPKFATSSFPLSEVIERLLLVGISDVDAGIRQTVLRHLDPTLDAYLASAENLRCLFIALNDEEFSIRETAIAIIGRLSLRNPSDVMPSLRRTLIQLLTELEFGGDSRLKEESAQLLSVLIRNSRNLIEPYVKPILKALLPKLDPSQDPRVRQEILSALGELAPVGHEMVAAQLNTLIPLIISYLADQSNPGRRELALRVLAQLARYTSHVLDLLSNWPELLRLLLGIARTEKSKFLRRSVLRVLGTLGAIDPHTHKMSQQSQASHFVEDDDDDDDKVNLVQPQPQQQQQQQGQQQGQQPNQAQQQGQQNNPQEQKKIPTTTVSKRVLVADPNSEYFYPYVAIKSMSNILGDVSLGAYHEKVVKSIVNIICECVGTYKISVFLPVVMPALLNLLGSAENAFAMLLLNQIAVIVSIAKGIVIVREYITQVFYIVSDLWHTELLPTILHFIEDISSVMGDDFMVFLPFLIPKLLSVLDSDNPEMCTRILRTLEWVGPNLDDYLHLVAPAIMTLVNQSDSEVIRIAAMQTIGRLCRVLNFSEFVSRIIQPMARLLSSDSPSHDFKQVILSTMCHLVHQLGSEFAIFVPVINRILNKRQITHATYEFLVSKVLKNQAILESELPLLGEITIAVAPTHTSTTSKTSKKSEKHRETSTQGKTATSSKDSTTGAGNISDSVSATSNISSGNAATGTTSSITSSNPMSSTVLSQGELVVNEANLKKAWLTISQSTRDDWDEWMRRFSVELVRESPQPALRHCLELAQEYFPLVRDLFTAAFVSCWTALGKQSRTEFTDNLRTALKSPHMPREIVQAWLNVAEFMEQARMSFPIEIKELGRLAFKCHAFAKALHYKELEFHAMHQPTPEAVEALITLNTQLQQPEAAEGMLRFSQERLNLDLRESWYEKLHRWEEALSVHQAKRFNAAPMIASLSGSTKLSSSPTGVASSSAIAILSSMSNSSTSTSSQQQQISSTNLFAQWPASTIPLYTETLNVASTNASTTSSSPSHHSAHSKISIDDRKDSVSASQQQLQKQLDLFNQSVVGEMRCLHSLGEWDRLLSLSMEFWKPELKNRSAIAPWAAAAAWHLQDWTSMGQFLEELKDTNVESLMMKTVLWLQKANTPAELEIVRQMIDKTRDAVDIELTPLLAESYQRAYDALVNVQLLSEMEEVIDYKLYPERRDVIRSVWRERLDRCQKSVSTWQRILAVRALAEMEESTWLKFAVLCRKSGSLRQSHKVLSNLMGRDPAKHPMAPLPTHRPTVTYQYILQLWSSGAKEMAYEHLVKFERNLEEQLESLGTNNVSLATLGLSSSSNPKSASVSTSTSVSKNNNQSFTSHKVSQSKPQNIPYKFGGSAQNQVQSTNVVRNQKRSGVSNYYNSQTINSSTNKKSYTITPTSVLNEEGLSKMQARCALTLGLWQLSLQEPSLDSEKIDLVIKNLGKALVCDPTWHKAWHVWAQTNFDIASIYDKRLTRSRHSNQRKRAAAASAMNNKLMSVNASSGNSAHNTALARAHSSYIVGAAGTTTTARHASVHPIIHPHQSSSNLASRLISRQVSLPPVGSGSVPISAKKSHIPFTSNIPGTQSSTQSKGDKSATTGIMSSPSPSPSPLINASVAAGSAVSDDKRYKHQYVLEKERLTRHVVAAVKGFFKSIVLGHGSQTLQDTLRLLTLWFKYGGDHNIEPVLQEGFNSVSIDTWLPVIPQIIARMDSNNLNVRRMVGELLSRIGKEHPQALVYPLVLTAKSTNTTRQSMAHTMMNQMRQYDQLHYQHSDYTSEVRLGSNSGTNAIPGSGHHRKNNVSLEDEYDDIGWTFAPHGVQNRNGRTFNTDKTDDGMYTHRASLPLHVNAGNVKNGVYGATRGPQGTANFTANLNNQNTGVNGPNGSNLGAYGYNNSNNNNSSMNAGAGGNPYSFNQQNQATFLSLIDQALMISEELIRVVISDTEAWHECLEEASRAYFVDHNPDQMIAVVKPLHEALMSEPSNNNNNTNFNDRHLGGTGGSVNGQNRGRILTTMELAFRQSYAAPLSQAWGWCLRYIETKSVMCLNQAWDLYWHVYHSIQKQQHKLTTLALSTVSPRLLNVSLLSLVVPGTYQVGEPLVTISGFHPVVTIIPSKQHPRKLKLMGSDGANYSFLLKGHEDLRQDERVMQLFGLINNLLLANPKTANKHLRIQRFAVIPLSPNSGLIGWVPHCDTINLLIKEYRSNAEPKIQVDAESRMLDTKYPEYMQLMVVQKFEVFRLIMDSFDGNDLAKILWLKSPSSEVWLDRRTNYIRSLAVMSMAGYILGLGDRHPSNIMIHRYSGQIVHIDFGDCFETAMLREKHPEKVPFRLTRMLINAMEVSGIEGTFRTTCIQVLEVLRENRDSLMAVLEAFVYDPLINWGLKAKAADQGTNNNTTTGTNTNNATNNNSDGNTGAKNGNNGDNQVNGTNMDGDPTTGASNLRGYDEDGFNSNTYFGSSTMASSGGFSAGSHRFREYTYTDPDESQLQYDGSVIIHPTQPIGQNQNAHPYGSGQAGANTTGQNSPGGAHLARGDKELNERALAVISRVHNKLTGRDFGDRKHNRAPLTVPEQVHKLIQQATSTENLCQSFSGWCPWW